MTVSWNFTNVDGRTFAGSHDPDAGILHGFERLREIGRKRKRNKLNPAGGDIADSLRHGSTAVTRHHNSANAKESGKTKQGAQILRVLHLIQRQPESSGISVRGEQSGQFPW